ncbi:A-kinase-interacting protein 1 [Trichosurus vulpecula]|uniref:A-kinase-interacting protein 1 n=1 Tax=Trichosurus vulpecula TaxID=9337 RepID=UPI00186B497C|nr:A-kinase-interacting protein 1 [Trichosurus vulpecula]
MAAALPWAITQGRMDDWPKERSLNWLDRETQKRLWRQSQELLQRAKTRAVNWCSRVEDPRGEGKPISLNTSFRTMADYMDYVSSQCGRFHDLAPDKAALNHVCRYHRNHLDPMSSSWVKLKKSTSHDPGESYQVTTTGPGLSMFDPGSSRFESGLSTFDPGSSKFDPRSSKFGPGPSWFKSRPSTFDPGSSKFDPRSSKFGPGPSRFDPGSSKFGPGPSRFDPGSSKFGPGPSRFDPGSSKFDPGPSRFDPEPSKFDSGRSKFDTGPSKSVARTSAKDITIEVNPGTYAVTVGSPDVTTTRMIEVDSGQIIDLSFPL